MAFNFSMAGMCSICGRGRNVANLRSKSNIAVKKVQKLNLQNFKIGGLTKLLCTRCIRTENKQTF